MWATNTDRAVDSASTEVTKHNIVIEYTVFLFYLGLSNKTRVWATNTDRLVDTASTEVT